MEAVTLSEARVYVGTYNKYNNGSLFGKWLDLSDYSDKDEFWKRAGNCTRTTKTRNLCFRITRISRKP